MATNRYGRHDGLSLEQFLAIPDDGSRLEVSAGRLVREPPPSGLHGRITLLLGKRLLDYALERGGVATTGSGYILEAAPLTVRGPDLSYMRPETSYRIGPGGYPEGAPDLAVEVVSPSDRPRRIQEKVEQYLAAGSLEVWVVRPDARTVTVHRASAEPRVVAGDETLESPDVLPGFALQLSDIFPGRRPGGPLRRREPGSGAHTRQVAPATIPRAGLEPRDQPAQPSPITTARSTRQPPDVRLRLKRYSTEPS